VILPLSLASGPHTGSLCSYLCRCGPSAVQETVRACEDAEVKFVACQSRMQCAWTTDAAPLVMHPECGLHLLRPVGMGFAVVFWLVLFDVPCSVRIR